MQALDVEGQELTYTWTQVSGPSVVLSDANSPSPTFTAPEGLANSDIVFELAVSDGTNTSVDTVTITVHADNDAPTAEAGPAQSVDELDVVTLSGSGSDVEGEALTYTWTQVSGPAVVLSDSNSASPTFTAPEGLANSDLVFELAVSDGTNTSVDTVTITVHADNDAPTAEAGPAQSVDELDVVTLSGSGSDVEGEALTYTWTQVSGPAVVLSDSNSASPTFTAPEGLANSDIVFELAVSDGTNTSVDTVTITVHADNDAPTAEAGPAQSVDELDVVTLSGSGSDVEGEALTYTWTQVSGPTVVLSDANSASPTFTAPEGLANSDIVFELAVSDGTNTSVDTVTITVNADDDAPTADAGSDVAVHPGSSVLVQGSGADVEGADLDYTWIQVGGPPVGSLQSDGPNLRFDAPAATTPTLLTFQLRVCDGEHTSVDTLHVLVTPEAVEPPAQDDVQAALVDVARFAQDVAEELPRIDAGDLAVLDTGIDGVEHANAERMAYATSEWSTNEDRLPDAGHPVEFPPSALVDEPLELGSSELRVADPLVLTRIDTAQKPFAEVFVPVEDETDIAATERRAAPQTSTSTEGEAPRESGLFAGLYGLLRTASGVFAPREEPGERSSSTSNRPR
ncbi:MAG: tandem-95 repeat protein [Planctomycetes bacterium]|nr:tandem-95 repeat protein [Planctomycetota bacterium]